MFKKFLLVSLLGCIALPAAMAQSTQPDYRVPSSVRVEQQDSAWTVMGKRLTLRLDPVTLALAIKTPHTHWNLAPGDTNDITFKTNGVFSQALTDAGIQTITPYQNGFETGLKLEFGQFREGDTILDVTAQLFLCLEGVDENVSFRAVITEGRAAVQQLLWPRGFEPASFDATVVPFMQGMLLPQDWPRKVWLYDSISYGRGLYMPWWGHQQDKAAVLVLLETPVDAGCDFAHPAGGPTHIQPRWAHSLGRFAYPRKLRMTFFDQGNYVDLAKAYRQYVMDTGHLVDLKTKIARNPLLEKLIGSPVVHTSILYHIQPDSSYYQKDDPSANHQLVTFADRATQLRQLAEQGIKKAYVHLDGWVYRGYDNLHPDILPPCPDAGGWDGMRHFADVCEELGFVFAVHDQYRDYYFDAQSFDLRHTVLNLDGSRYTGSTWYGGKQSILCSSFAPGHVMKNHQEIHRQGVKLRGAYLDVFAVVPPDECSHPEHPVTRQQCLDFRGDCFDIIRSFGGVVSSEEPADWAIPYLDLVHHGPYALDPNPGKGPAMGIPVPLLSLVYHDAILLPWSLGRGEWGIPENDLGYLHGLLNAGLPYLSLTPDAAHRKQVETLCALHERVGLLEMTKHEFLDSSHRRQRSTFADGTTITIDLNTDQAEITPPLD